MFLAETGRVQCYFANIGYYQKHKEHKYYIKKRKHFYEILEAIMVLPDIINLYPSTHAAEAVEKVGDKIRHLCPLSSICDII